MVSRAFALLGLVSVVIAGCSSGSGYSSLSPAPTPTPPPACFPAVPAITLAYPIAGATAIPGSITQLVFQASSSVDLSSWSALIGLPSPVNGKQVPLRLGGPLGAPPSPLPSPIATLAPGNAYYGASIPGLSAATQYQTAVSMPNLTCLAPLLTGVFTTQ